MFLKGETTMNRNHIRKVLKEVLHLYYPVKIRKASDGYTAVYPDLPGCYAFGLTIEEVKIAAEDAKREWMIETLENGDSVPAPRHRRALTAAIR